jgi:hypothetical protein
MTLQLSICRINIDVVKVKNRKDKEYTLKRQNTSQYVNQRVSSSLSFDSMALIRENQVKSN